MHYAGFHLLSRVCCIEQYQHLRSSSTHFEATASNSQPAHAKYLPISELASMSLRNAAVVSCLRGLTAQQVAGFPMRGVMPVQMMLAEVLSSQFDTPAHDA